MENSVYTEKKVKRSYKEVNWIELNQYFANLFNPLSLREFRGYVTPSKISQWASSHWMNQKEEKGFGELMSLSAGSNWEAFSIQFFDSSDAKRFIKLNVNCKKNNFVLEGSLDNERKLIEGLNGILPIFGAKNIKLNKKNRFYKKWWFILIIAPLIVVLIAKLMDIYIFNNWQSKKDKAEKLKKETPGQAPSQQNDSSSSTAKGIKKTEKSVNGPKTVNNIINNKSEQVIKNRIAGFLQKYSRELDILKDKSEKDLAGVREESFGRVQRSGLVRYDTENKLKEIYLEIDDLIETLKSNINQCLYENNREGLDSFKEESLELKKVEDNAQKIKEYLKLANEQTLKSMGIQ